MDNSMPPLFVMGVDENGQNVYVDQTDATHSFIFDNGNLTQTSSSSSSGAGGGGGGGINIKLEADLTEEDASNDMLTGPMGGELDDAQLVMMNGLDEVHFEDSLMQELDSDLMNIEENNSENYIMQHIDIREPLSKLRRLLELRLSLEMNGYEFVLQGTQLLESHKNLVDQCVQGEGVVQVNVQIQQHLKRINIIDVLKPAEDYMGDMDNELLADDDAGSNQEDSSQSQEYFQDTKKPVHEWQVDSAFKNEQERLKIPSNPEEWSVFHVRHWIQWAVRQFNLPHLMLSDWSITGGDLFAMDIHDFQKVVPSDPGDVFWTHFELLRKMKVVAVIKDDKLNTSGDKKPTKLMKHNKVNKVANSRQVYQENNAHMQRTGSGNSGQIQLWQFLLELLTTRDYKNVIFWLGAEGEFKLNQPEIVAKLWGERKNKPTMNYEKLSRALRYYYEGDMISKVHGKRFVYKFVCDLKQLLGYSAVELAKLVNYRNPFFTEVDMRLFK